MSDEQRSRVLKLRRQVCDEEIKKAQEICKARLQEIEVAANNLNCINCQQEIELARLLQKPGASQCATCAREWTNMINNLAGW